MERRNGPKWQPRQDAVGAMIARGMTAEQIGKHYGVSREAIWQVVRRFGIGTPAGFMGREPGPESPAPQAVSSYVEGGKTVNVFERGFARGVDFNSITAKPKGRNR